MSEHKAEQLFDVYYGHVWDGIEALRSVDFEFTEKTFDDMNNARKTGRKLLYEELADAYKRIE